MAIEAPRRITQPSNYLAALFDDLMERPRTVKRGGQVYLAGSTANNMFIVRDGLVKETLVGEDGKTHITAFASDFNPVLLGYEVFDAERIYLTQAEAIIPSRVSRIPAGRIWERMRMDPGFLEQVTLLVAGLVRTRTERHNQMVFYDLQARAADGLLQIANQLANFAENTDRLPEINRVTQEDIASYIGGTRASLNKMLGYWEDKGWIKREGRRIVITNPFAIGQISMNLTPVVPTETSNGGDKPAVKTPHLKVVGKSSSSL